METLALLGGETVLKDALPKTSTYGKEEEQAALAVIRKGIFSGFLARAGERFLGGKEVLRLEEAFRSKFNVAHAVSFNSATTALDAAVCALGIGPGDEVIVSPYTMCASATAVLMNMAIPVFADIEEDTFCLDPKSVEKRITRNTKAIMVTNLFGGSARYDALLSIAKRYGLKIIEDTAQAPGGMYHGKHLGTIGDIGIYSFNVHKVVQCGEGGILVTNNNHYAFRAQLKRNHGENVLDDMDIKHEPIFGSNYRMSELHATIASEQFKKIDHLNQIRIDLAAYLSLGLKDIPWLSPCHVLEDTRHVYYLYPILYDQAKTGIPRSLFAKAIKAEGFPIDEGYQKPLHLLSIFQQRKIFPNSDFPFGSKEYPTAVSYEKGICPTSESMWEKNLVVSSLCKYPNEKKHIGLFLKALKKVFVNRDKLLSYHG